MKGSVGICVPGKRGDEEMDENSSKAESKVESHKGSPTQDISKEGSKEEEYFKEVAIFEAGMSFGELALITQKARYLILHIYIYIY